MSLFPIFKVNKLSDKNVTDTIYVFYGSMFSEEIEDPNDLFDDFMQSYNSNTPNSTSNNSKSSNNESNKKFPFNVFTKPELQNISKNSLAVFLFFP